MNKFFANLISTSGLVITSGVLIVAAIVTLYILGYHGSFSHNASTIKTGTISDSILPPQIAKYNDQSPVFENTILAPYFTGNGKYLTDINGANVTGTVANATTAVNFTGSLFGDVTGTQNATVVSHVSDSALSVNVTLKGNIFNQRNDLVELGNWGELPSLNGFNLYNLNASKIDFGTLSDYRLSYNVAKYNDWKPTFQHELKAPYFDGNGKELTALTGAQVTGTVANATTAENFTGSLVGDVTGTQGATVVSPNVAKYNDTNPTFANTLTAPFFTGNGENLTDLTGGEIVGNIIGNAANVTGVVALTNGGTGVTSLADLQIELGLGSLADQSSSSITVTGGTIDSVTIGGITPAAVHATTLTATGSVDFSTATSFKVPNTTSAHLLGSCTTPGTIVYSTTGNAFYGCVGSGLGDFWSLL